MAVRRSCWLWKSNREKSIRARRSQASISLLVSYSNFVSSISLYLSLFSPSPISFRYSFVLRITVSASEDSNVSYIYLYPFPSLLHIVTPIPSSFISLSSPSFLAATRLSTYLSPHVSLCPSIRRFSTSVFTPSSRFFHCLVAASLSLLRRQSIHDVIARS